MPDIGGKDPEIHDANRVYLEANNDLTKELRLHLIDKYTESTRIIQFKDSFLENGRLDAEYYQPQYDILFARLEQFETKQLGDIVCIKKSIEPGSDYYQAEGIPFNSFHYPKSRQRHYKKTIYKIKQSPIIEYLKSTLYKLWQIDI